MNGDGVLLKDKKPDPDFPPAGEHAHIDQGAHERMGIVPQRRAASACSATRTNRSTRTSSSSSRSIPAATASAPRSGASSGTRARCCPRAAPKRRGCRSCSSPATAAAAQHPSYVLGYYDAPSLEPKEHEFVTWLNYNETIGFNAASLAPVANYTPQGPRDGLHRPGHRLRLARHRRPAARRLAAAQPSAAVRRPAAGGVQAGRATRRPRRRRASRCGRRSAAPRTGPIPSTGIWTVQSEQPLADADRLLADFLPQGVPPAGRRDEVRKQYVAKVDERLKAGDCFETAMRWAYRAALCSPDFLYHVEPAGQLDDHALACRLSYFLWNSLPDDALIAARRRRQAARRRSRCAAKSSGC